MRPDTEFGCREWSSVRALDEVCDVLNRHEVPFLPAHEPSDVYRSPQAEARAAWVMVPDPGLGDVRTVADPVKSDRMPDAEARPAPQIDADNEDVLTTWTAAPAAEGDGQR
jgi:crotonobetainyl-CoA:carnitine CoA-transferase CaiB-like acyl-CoA transferase